MYSWVPASRIQKFGGSSMAAYLQRRADGQKHIRDAALTEKKTMTYPDRGGAAEEHRRSPHRCVCCWPSVLRKERRLGFFGLEEEEGKESFGR